jgi:conjugative relaxase-like TrwC/TraI family protein
MRNSGQAKSYYTQALACEDGVSREAYYSEAQEAIGSWGGKGAARLGLVGSVEQEQFGMMCDNIHPNSSTGESLTPRTKTTRRVGYDMNFHCPKSVSLYHAMTGDDRVLIAFRAAVNETMTELETDTKTRVRLKGQDTTRKTGELTWATFEHYTARPVNAVPDPHLHAHVVCFNATYDKSENRWKAMDISDIKRDSTYYEAAFHARFAGRLSEAGFAIERTVGRWELAGIDKSMTGKFQERTNQIEKLASDMGITDGDEKDALGAKTRASKIKDMTRTELREVWNGRLTDAEREAIAAVAWQEVKPKTPAVSVERAIDYAKLHGYERDSVIAEKRLMAHALHYGVGSVSVEEVNREVVRFGNGLITREVDGQRLTTTPEVLAEETRMLAFARDGRGTCTPLAWGREINNDLLSAEQRTAVRHVWESGDRVMLVRGAAGVGKTTLMKEVVDGVEVSGTKVYSFAPSASASRGTLRAEGFLEADTLASLLQNRQVQEQVRDSLIWVDEAGQIGSRDLAKLFDVAHEMNARVLLTGDVSQHGPVARGDGMRLLQDQAGCHSAEVLEIRRQAGGYRDAVKALSRGDGAAGFQKLDALGFIRELDGEERHRQMAADYLGSIKGYKDPEKQAICIAPTHREGAAISAEIRQGLKARGRLGQDERKLVRFKNRSLTEAERGDAVNYVQGDTVQVVQNIKGLTRGERLTVIGRDGVGAVQAARANGGVIDLPLKQAERFQVYQSGALAIAPGDMLRVTQNGYSMPGTLGKKHRLDNGDLFTVKGFTESGDLKLTNGWVVSKQFGHWDHGYCQTSYSSQSRTVKHVFIAQGEESLAATDLKQFYVSVSRGKTECQIYTDSKEGLFERIQRTEQRLAATELMVGVGQESSRRLDRLREQAELVARIKAHEAASLGGSREDRGAVSPPVAAPTREVATRETGYER